MKQFILIFLLTLMSAQLFAQNPPYKAKIRAGELRWSLHPQDCQPEDDPNIYSWDGGSDTTFHSCNEWQMDVYVDIFDANNRRVYFSGPTKWWKDPDWENDWNGPYQPGPLFTTDGHKIADSSHPAPPECSECSYHAFRVFAWAFFNGDTLISDTLRIPDSGMDGMNNQKRIVVTQKNEAQEKAGYFKYEYKDDASLGSGVFHEFPAEYLDSAYVDAFYSQSFTRSISAEQGFLGGTNEKFNSWAGNMNVTDVVNHRNFALQENIENVITATHKEAYNATLQCEFNGSPIAGTDVAFKDPWLVDDESHPLGPRNRGMDASFTQVSSGSNNVGVNSQWKGVFLNQSGPGASWQGTYYSVKASSHLFFWPMCETWSEDEEHPHQSHLFVGPAGCTGRFCDLHLSTRQYVRPQADLDSE